MSDLERGDNVFPDPRDHPVIKAMMRLAPRGEVAAQLWQDIFDLQERRAAQMIEAAALVSGDRLDQLVQHLQEDDRAKDLLLAALRSAARAAGERELRTVGRLLASGVLADDDALLDLDETCIAIMGDLGRSAVRRLDRMYELRGRIDEILMEPDRPRTAAEEVDMAALQRHGLIRDIGAGTYQSIEGKHRWVPSALGEYLVGKLRDSAEDLE